MTNEFYHGQMKNKFHTSPILFVISCNYDLTILLLYNINFQITTVIFNITYLTNGIEDRFANSLHL